MRSVIAVLAVSLAACAASSEPPTAPENAGDPPATYGATVTEPSAPGATSGSASETEGTTSKSRPGAKRAIATPVLAARFESASAVCNDWPEEGAIAIRSVPPRSGSYACRICATGDAPSIAISHALGALAPGRYELTAWLRARPSYAAPAVVTASFEATTASGPLLATAVVAPGDDYTRATTIIDVGESASDVVLRIAAPAAPGECVLIDDIALTPL